MAGNDLTATLGVDGKPFQDGLNNLFSKTTAAVGGVGRRMGQQLIGGMMAVVGYSFIRKMIGETQRWAKDTAKVREEYEKMGIVITDEFANKMAQVGREFTVLGAQYREMMLPVIAGIASASLSFLQNVKEAAVYWKFMSENSLSNKLDVAADYWNEFHRAMQATKPQWQSERGLRWNIMNKLGSLGGGSRAMRAYVAHKSAKSYVDQHSDQPAMTMGDAHTQAGAVLLDMRERWEQMMKSLVFSSASEPFKLGSSSRGGGSRLASIGGDVGGLNDRVVRIEQEQVRILKQIASNTKPKGAGGQLEIPTS
jgi:hypothetical protein